MYKMCTLLQAIGINIYYLANCTDSDKFLQRFKYVGLNTKVSSQPGEQTQQEGWNGDICSNGVARPKEQVNVFQQFLKKLTSSRRKRSPPTMAHKMLTTETTKITLKSTTLCGLDLA